MALSIDKMLGEELEEIYCVDFVEPAMSLQQVTRCKWLVGDFFSNVENFDSSLEDRYVVDGWLEIANFILKKKS